MLQNPSHPTNSAKAIITLSVYFNTNPFSKTHSTDKVSLQTLALILSPLIARQLQNGQFHLWNDKQRGPQLHGNDDKGTCFWLLWVRLCPYETLLALQNLILKLCLALRLSHKKAVCTARCSSKLQYFKFT